MLRLSSKLISILLLALVFLGGCGTGPEGPGQDPDAKPTQGSNMAPVEYRPAGKPVYGPVDITYAIENPLQFIQINLSEEENHRRNYFQIAGLIDKDVEERINTAIEALYQELLPYGAGEKRPPYRGIEAAMGDKEIRVSDISVSPNFNYNNVLSVLAYSWIGYIHPSQGQTYSAFCETLNFDLNTGETFLIQDVFTNDCSGLEIINDTISDEIKRRSLTDEIGFDFSGKFNLVAPFKGVSPEQKFFLSPYGLNIVIDYNNPEFDVGFEHATVTLPFYSQEGSVAITERFFDKNQVIFVNPATHKRFLPDYQVNTTQERDFYDQDGIQWYITLGHPANLPQQFIQLMNNLRADREGGAAFLKGEGTISFVEQYLHAHRIGPYVNINTHIHVGRTNDVQWREANYVYTQNGEPVELQELFVEGYDYFPVIKDALAKNIKDYRLSQDYDSDDILKDLIFRINESDISFITQPYQWDNTSKYPLHLTIPYEQIGYENLNIFR